MFIYFKDTHKSLKIIAPIGICLAVLSAVYSGTRGSFIAIIPLTFIVLYKLNNKNKIVFSLLLTSLLILALNYTNLGDRVIRMQTTIGNYVDGSNTYTSAGVRLDLWKSAFCMFKENPVFGVGPRSFRNEMNVETSDCVPVNPKLKKNNQAHNVYMNTIATKGSVGLFSFLALLLASVLYAFRNNNPAKYIVFAAIASMLSYGLTVDLLFKSFLVDRHLVLIAILIGVRANQK
jgi:O-antigen ligase